MGVSWSLRHAGLCTLAVMTLHANGFAQAPAGTAVGTRGTPAVTTQQLSGTVISVEGNKLLVKLDSGEHRMFTPPASRKFVIDGKELSLSQLQPGTKLNATYTETRTPVTVRTQESISGRVIYVAPPTVVVQMSNGESKMFSVPADSPAKFRDGTGKETSVFDLRKDMVISASKVTEVPQTELVTTTTVTGTAR